MASFTKGQEIRTHQNAVPPKKKPPVSTNNEPHRLIPLHGNSRNQSPDKLPEEMIIEKCLCEKNEEAVIKALYNGIVKYAKLKKFLLAERLRKKLIEIAPMALTEIVRASEVLEQEQSAAMDPQKMIPFANLFKTFTQSESVAFYFGLKDFKAKPHIPVFEQCKFDNRLYFIQSGRLILSYYDAENRQNIDFSILQKGDIAGVEAFLRLTSHGTTLTPIEDSKISYLDKSIYRQILQEHPAIDAKLIHFCESHKKVCRIDASKRQARRLHKRYPTSLQGHVQKISPKGKLMDDVSRVTIVDISSGGLCYTVQNMKSDEAALIHKNYILISASYQAGPITKRFKKLAKIISLKFHAFGECSVHVKFKDPINSEKIIEITQGKASSAINHFNIPEKSKTTKG